MVLPVHILTNAVPPTLLLLTVVPKSEKTTLDPPGPDAATALFQTVW
jgi:hypothetical protein